jgi:predicted MFS family arabinose efflux permease
LADDSKIASKGARAAAASSSDEPFGWRFVTPLFMGSALNPINSTLIATALVPIAHDMHVSVGRTTVLVSALYLASAVAQPTAGKLAEEFGPRRVFLTGIALILLGGVLGAIAQSLAVLIIARVLIGVGTSAGYPSAMLLIRRRAIGAGMAAPPGNILGGLSIAGTVTVAVGPPIGGVLVGAFGWQSVFLVNVPVAAAAFAMALFWIPRDNATPPKRAREVAARIDVLGIVGFGGTMTALLVFLMGLPHLRWLVLATAVAAALALVWWELRTPTPFFDVRQLVSNIALTRTYLRATCTLLGVYTVLYGLTQWLQVARGYSAERAGLLILPMGALAAIVIRPISARNLVRSPLIAAAASMLIASIGVLFLTTHSPVALIIAVTLIFGITTGTTTTGNQTALYAQAPADQLATASGLFRTFSYVGSIASSTITGIVFRKQVTDHGLHTLAYVLISAAALVLIMTVLDRRLKTPTPAATPVTDPGDLPLPPSTPTAPHRS